MKIRQDNELYATVLAPGETVEHALKPDRHAYVQVARGSVTLNGKPLEAGDGAAISAEKSLQLDGRKRRGSPALRPGVTASASAALSLNS